MRTDKHTNIRTDKRTNVHTDKHTHLQNRQAHLLSGKPARKKSQQNLS